MWSRSLFLVCLSIIWGEHPLLAAPETDDTQQLSTADVGPYRPETTPDLKAAAQRIVEATNEFRAEHKLEPVARQQNLDATALKFAQYMAKTDRYGHQADGRQPAERAEAQGYDFCQIAENIGYFFQTTGFASKELADAAVKGWIESPGHRENMLRPHVTQIGVGVAQSEKTGLFYAVQLFGRPESASIEFRVSNRSQVSVRYSLGEEQFDLEPRFTRTHRLCIPARLSLLEGEKEVRTLSPESGASYIVEDGLKISMEQASAP